MIPTIEECFRVMDEYRMLVHIKAHSVMVAKVAEVIVRRAGKAAVDISLDLTVAAALLHDIGKSLCLDSDEDHAEVGREICLRHGLREVADIVAEHVILKNGVPSTGYTEKETVYYADKRVNHDKVVSLDDRLAYILERYGNNNDFLCRAIRRNYERCIMIEDRLFADLDFRPEDLDRLVDEGTFLTDCLTN